ncbi:6-hydroxymethylpterin diphosphokinase MptE-like protein [Facilibium subflavum]|uniref:6-hydroxymethylpterin diphosphokinase MptE-like protein n=1 Tax=Facilibium subflavum TaxID=2219058 RepID=UPI000E65AF17|nr:6-hydroxymethylpterin diphosphokinase MptE-like protein [Facilibium subflavum]
MRQNKKKLAALKNKHLNQPCIIIGGGPSINKMDLNRFKDMVTIACNGFYLKMEELDFIPTYYTVEDHLPATDNKLEIMSLKETIKVIPYDLKHIIKPDNDTVYINFLRSYMRPKNEHFPLFGDEFEKKSYWGGTVLYMNIQLAHYLGCNPIYLIGVDLSYKVPNTVKKAGAVLTSTEDDMNHFDPRYFGKGKKWHLPETQRMQQSFTKAYHELKKRNVKLVNAGVDSQLKVIPKGKVKF